MIKHISGKTRKIMLPNGEEHKAVYAIVDLIDIIASHNEITFNDSVGYPTENGRNINDRNYKEDIAAQRNVQKIARELVPETLISLSATPSGTPIINNDGFVVSGNNRVMSLKLAIKEYPENYNKYKEQLAQDADSFGFKEAGKVRGNAEGMMGAYYFDNDMGSKVFMNPVLVRIDESLPNKLNTEVLAAYNQDTKKGERPVDKAIKLASILESNSSCKNAIISIVNGYDTFSDLYSAQGKSDRKKIVDTLIQCGLITEAQLPNYYDSGEFTENGKDFLETLLSAIILNQDALKVIGAEGVKKYRQTIISSLPVLITNKSLKEYSLTNDISDAVILQYKIAQVGGDFSDYTHSQSLFSEDKPKEKALYLNALLRSGKNTFKAAIKRYTDSVKEGEGASLFGEKLPASEIFEKAIISAIDSTDKKLIEQLYKKEEPKQSKKGVSLGFGSMGSGTTVWDRNTTINGDYVTVAHISDYGEVKYYSGVFIPDYAKKEIENYASTVKDKMKYSTYKTDIPKTKQEPIKQYEFYKGVSYDYKNPYEYNRAVEELIKDKENFNAEEKAFISYYSGYGGLEKFGATGKGLLYEYFTPKAIVEKMWGLAYKYGFTGGYVLEPSIGVGEFAKFAPDLLKLTGYEINSNSAKICKILYPDATIINEAFETIFIKNRASIKNKFGDVKKYSLVIGNPPYGDFGGLYAGMGEKGYTKAENYIDYFITRGLDLLEPNGLLIMIIGAEVATGGKPFLSKGTSTVKKEIMDKSILVDAYRLPNGVFERTDVLTDIIVLRKK